MMEQTVQERVVLETPEAVAQRLADEVTRELRDRLSQAEEAHVALSGGASPKRLYSLLAARKDITPEDWRRVHLWMVDERRVALGDSRLNFGMIQETLVARVPIPNSHVHPMPVDRNDGDRIYEDELRTTLGPGAESLDIVLLGMGPDGHIASLFPFTPAVDVLDRWIVWNDGERVAPPRPRMTMTYPLLNRARFTAFLVTGVSKRPALTALSTGHHDHRALPVAGIRPTNGGRLIWVLDQAANP